MLLRGDPAKVTITIDGSGATAEIVIDWHDAFEVTSPNGPLTSSRVDIGVFAVADRVPSAPAILSVSFPSHHVRTYREGLGGNRVLESIEYDAWARGATFDTVLHWAAPWRDEAIRDADGEITGWRRTSAAIVRDIPAGPESPAYELRQGPGGLPVLAPALP